MQKILFRKILFRNKTRCFVSTFLFLSFFVFGCTQYMQDLCSLTRDWKHASRIAGRFFTTWATSQNLWTQPYLGTGLCECQLGFPNKIILNYPDGPWIQWQVLSWDISVRQEGRGHRYKGGDTWKMEREATGLQPKPKEHLGIETCIISYMKRVASPGSKHDTGCLGLVHWDDPEGWYEEGGGFRMGNTCIPVADSFWCMAKPIQYCKFKK